MGLVASLGAEVVRWVGTWACALQLTEPAHLPPAPGLSDGTLRQVVQVSVGGALVRAHFSNAYGERPLVVVAAGLAISAGAGSIVRGSDRRLTFGGKREATIPPGGSLVSDPVAYPLAGLARVAVTLRFGRVPAAVTGHPGSRTTSYLDRGSAVDAPRLRSAVPIDHWYVVSGIDVCGSAAAVVVLGDSLTDGRGSTPNGQDRWPDELARRLHANPATSEVAVLNQGIGGNAVLAGGLGPAAVDRFDRDVLGPSGVRWVIVLEGVNDIGTSRDPQIASRLIAAYRGFIERAHEAGLRAYAVPILPFGGSEYASPAHEAARTEVNRWIRTSGAFDAVIDLDPVVRDPASPTDLSPRFDSGDHLHLNAAGYAAMAGAVDLALFTRAAASGP